MNKAAAFGSLSLAIGLVLCLISWALWGINTHFTSIPYKSIGAAGAGLVVAGITLLVRQ